MNERLPASPNDRPVVVFDGECDFCGLWIERWKQTATEDRVRYVTSQEATGEFPECSAEEFENAVKLRTKNGTWHSGAAAVFHLLALGDSGSWLLSCYQHLPGFAPISEAVYALIARHRLLASRATRLLFGIEVRRPEYFAIRRWFLRGLGLVHLIAFVSLWVQVEGLIGREGILPVADFLGAVEQRSGPERFHLLPTLCWLDRSDGFLHFLCGGGAVISCLLVAGLAPLLALPLLWAFYLSLTIAGQTFLSFQWDILLLEVTFCAIFLAPWQIRPRRESEPPVSRVGLFLLRWLLFRFMFASGLAKLTSGDDAWWNLSALQYHYETQPLPTIFGWLGHQLPEWFGTVSVGTMFVIEMVVPFLIFGPRRVRLFAFAALAGFQILIAFTGNYGFFNLLSIVLCLVVLDDTLLPSQRGIRRPVLHRAGFALPAMITVPVAAVIVALGLMLLASDIGFRRQWLLTRVYDAIQPAYLVNPYGLFRVMTRERPEIVVEGSNDGTLWLPYEFKWKPGGDLPRPLPFVAPHQPRLDWQMWFAALGAPAHNPWFLSFLGRLLDGSPPVLALLRHNPFGDAPPRYVRATLYDYRMTDFATLRREGKWWRREERGTYIPPVSLR